MHKKFYASGFLFHTLSNQILLQQHTASDTISPWSFIGGISDGILEPESVFKAALYANLGLTLDVVYPVYTYGVETAQIPQHIFYGELDQAQEFSPHQGFTFSWFTFKQILSLDASEQVKHDIIIGQRVIDAAVRKSLGLQHIYIPRSEADRRPTL
jgi:hypothetical protein